QVASLVHDCQRGGRLGVKEPVDLTGEQRWQHIAGFDSHEAPAYGIELELLLGTQVSPKEGQVHRRQGRYRDSQWLLEDLIDALWLQLVAEDEARVSGIGTAHYRERGWAAALDQPRVETRNLRCAAHIEIEITAPELLHALHRLTRL